VVTKIKHTHQSSGAARKRNAENHKMLMHRDLTTSEKLLEENNTHDFELPFLKFQDILVTTNNFSNTLMIGQGGFGKVYKVIIYLWKVSFFACSSLIIG
jgi:hypothetical protein